MPRPAEGPPTAGPSSLLSTGTKLIVGRRDESGLYSRKYSSDAAVQRHNAIRRENARC
jgi:hypothetical protein